MKTTIDRDQQASFTFRDETPRAQGPTLPAEATRTGRPTLLLSVYPAPPQGPDSFHRWPVPLKQRRISSGENMTACLLDLLRDGGPGSYVQVEILIP